MKKDTSWGEVAGWYDDLLENKDGTYQKDVILPNLMRLLDPKETDTILDIACGQGYFSRSIAQSKAKVIGTDISRELIDIAKDHSPDNIDYHVSPADRLDFCKEDSVDKAIIVLALQNIENYNGVIRETYRSLKRGGRFYIVLNHPSFRIPKHSSWQWDEKGNSQYRRIDAYMTEFKEKIEMNPGANEKDRKYTVSFHRPLQVYFKGLNNAGFLISRFEEWISNRTSNKGPRSSEENRIRKEIPIFAIIEAIKN